MFRFTGGESARGDGRKDARSLCSYKRIQRTVNAASSRLCRAWRIKKCEESNGGGSVSEFGPVVVEHTTPTRQGHRRCTVQHTVDCWVPTRSRCGFCLVHCAQWNVVFMSGEDKITLCDYSRCDGDMASASRATPSCLALVRRVRGGEGRY